MSSTFDEAWPFDQDAFREIFQMSADSCSSLVTQRIYRSTIVRKLTAAGEKRRCQLQLSAVMSSKVCFDKKD